MRICILGCGGFIGSHLAERLCADGRHEVVGIDRTDRKLAHLAGHPCFEYRQIDVSTHDAARDAIEGADVVVHLVAICNPAFYTSDPVSVIAANFQDAAPAIDACVETGTRLVYFSTCEVYGRTVASFLAPDNPQREDPALYVMSEDSTPLLMGPVDAQRWTYACAKQLSERLVFARGAEHGLEFTIVRPFNFIGPRMDFLPGIDGEGTPRVFPRYMKALLAGEPLDLVDGGKAMRAFTYIDDAIDACVRIIERPLQSRGMVFNIGSPANETTIAGLADLMIDLYREMTGACSSVTRSIPARELYGEGYQDCDRRVPDITRARTYLEWEPITSLRGTFENSMKYYVERYARQ